LLKMKIVKWAPVAVFVIVSMVKLLVTSNHDGAALP
jgi:hypothetical protein